MARFRQGTRSPSLRVRVFKAVDGTTAFVDFPVEFPGGVTYRMVGAGLVITGVAVGQSDGWLAYDWGAADLVVAGIYEAYFVGIDALGRSAVFPSGTNLQIVVVPTI